MLVAEGVFQKPIWQLAILIVMMYECCAQSFLLMTDVGSPMCPLKKAPQKPDFTLNLRKKQNQKITLTL